MFEYAFIFNVARRQELLRLKPSLLLGLDRGLALLLEVGLELLDELPFLGV